MDPKTTVVSKLNELAKPTDYKSLYILAQQAFENGFRGMTVPELVGYLSNNLPEELVRSEFIYDEAKPSVPLTNPGRKASMFAAAGTYTTPSGTLILTKDFNVIGWDGAKWVKMLEIEVEVSGFAEKEISALPFAVKNKASTPLVLNATLPDGSQWPVIESAISRSIPIPVSTASGLSKLENRTQYYDISRDGIWNQWIEPQAAIDNEGNTWIASVGYHGDLYVTKRTQEGTAFRKKIGNILSSSGQSDDHNSPAILLDDRPYAPYPIIVFQCDHNTRPMRYWRFASKDMSTWDSVAFTIGTENVAYTQAWRNNDEIFVLSRIPTGVRPWRIAYSSDNGGSWTTRTIFSTPASWLYCLGRLKIDGSGVNIAMHGHPLNSSNQNIYFLEFDFASGAIVNPANRAVPVIADIRAAISNPSFVPIDPFVVGLKLYATTGTQITRLWDVSRDVNGDCAVVFNIFSSSVGSMENFHKSKYAVTSFKLSDGIINHTTEIEESGMPVENPAGNNFYTAGASMVSNSKALVMLWRNDSMIAGGDDTTGNIGKTLCQTIDFSNPSALIKKEMIISDLKVIRPFTLGSEFLCNECEYFNDYYDFYSNVLINKIQ